MIKVYLEYYSCYKCKHYPKDKIPKRCCKTCNSAYTSNYKLAKEYNPKYQKRIHLKQSDNRLRTLYNRIKIKYFEDNYIPDGKKIAFYWKRGQGAFGGWCNKRTKEIRIGSIYKYAFEKKTLSTNNMAVTDNFNEVKRKDLVELIIHEAVHLRMAHHKKRFKRKVSEIISKIKDEDIISLYGGLLNEN